MAGERRDADFMHKSLDEIAAEMDPALYERETHHKPQHRFSPYPADHGPSWRAEKETSSCGAGLAPPVGGGEAAKVFAANLSYGVTWQQLKDHMKRAGPVLKCDLFKNVDGTSRGMGLVLFADSESADRAIRELNGTELDGRKIFLRKDMRVEEREKVGMVTAHPKQRPPPNPASTVFIANLDYSITWQKLRDIFKVAGRVVHVDVQVDKTGRPKGCAGVQFDSPSEAVNAIILFHGQMLQNRPMVVRMDSKAPHQLDPIQLRLLVGKAGLLAPSIGGGATEGGRGLVGSGAVGGWNLMGGGATAGGTGLIPSLSRPLNPPLPLGGGALSLPLATPLAQPSLPPAPPSLPSSHSSSSFSSSSPNTLPILAALGLSALNNLQHFSSEQLTLLGISPALLQQAIGNTAGVVGGGAGGVANSGGGLLLGQGPSTTDKGGGGGGGLMGVVSQLPFTQSLLQQKPLPEKEISFRMPHDIATSLAREVPMATSLSLATALTTSSSKPLTDLNQPILEMGKKGKRVFVRNLSFSTTWQTLKDHLKIGTGTINYVDILKGGDGRSRGCAAVIFEDEAAAERAIRLFDQSELDGRRINIRFDRAN